MRVDDFSRTALARHRRLQKGLIWRAAKLQNLRFQMADVSALAEQILLPFRVLFGQEIDLPVAYGLVDF